MKSAAIILALCCAPLHVSAQEIVIRSPSGIWNTDNIFPFLIEFPTSSMRYQQVWAASGFTSRIPQGGWIVQMAFTVDGQTGPFFGTTLQDVQINVSTTIRGADSLSLTFQDNIGGDETVVHQRGPVNLPPARLTFDQVISFDIPFFYDPREGNLLMDVWNYRGYTPDGHSQPGYAANNSVSDSVSRVVATSVESLTGNLSTIGLVAQFTVIPIPEPSPWMLASLAIALGVLNQWRRNVRKGS